MSKCLKLFITVAFITGFSVVFLGAGIAAKGEATNEDVTEQKVITPEPPMVKVNLCLGPVFDQAPVWVAKQKGFFEDVNIRIPEEIPMGNIQFAARALVAGDIDIGGEGTLTIPGTYCNLTKNTTVMMVLNQWWGNTILARPGSGFKTYSDFLKEYRDPEKALEMVSRQIKGRTWVTQLKTSVDNVVDVITEAGGFSWKDIDFIDMKYAEGAIAFVRGEGDFYSGRAPDNYRVMDLTNAYPILTSRDLDEPSLVWISLFAVRRDWLAENEDTVLRLLSVWYRVTDLVNGDNWEEIVDLEREWVKKSSGTDFTRERAKWILDNIQPQLTFEDAGKTYFLTSFKGFPNWLQWRLDWDIKFQEELGNISKGGVKAEDLDDATRLYKKLVELKKRTETNIVKLERELEAGNVEDEAVVTSFLEKVKYWYNIRDYLDSARASDAALKYIK